MKYPVLVSQSRVCEWSGPAPQEQIHSFGLERVFDWLIVWRTPINIARPLVYKLQFKHPFVDGTSAYSNLYAVSGTNHDISKSHVACTVSLD